MLSATSVHAKGLAALVLGAEVVWRGRRSAASTAEKPRLSFAHAVSLQNPISGLLQAEKKRRQDEAAARARAASQEAQRRLEQLQVCV